MRKLSASSMSTYEKCPRKYYYQYIDKPDIEIPDWPHLEFGTVAHRALELFHEYLIKNILPPKKWPELLRAAFKKSLKESRKRNKMYLIKDEIPHLRKILQDYLDKTRDEGLPPVIHNELGFNFKIKGFTVRGYMDRIDKHKDGTYHVVDYKTSKKPKYLTDFQLALYALALKEEYDDVDKIKGSYVLLKHKSELKSWDITEDLLEETKNKVIAIGTDINTEKLWKKNPTILCNWCDFRKICQDSWAEDSW